VGDDIMGKVAFTAKDADKAKALSKTMEAGLESAIADAAKQNNKEIKTVGEVLKTVKITTKDDTIVMEGHGGADAIQAFFNGVLFWGAASEVAPARKN
jgi:hypothetical protein